MLGQVRPGEFMLGQDSLGYDRLSAVTRC